MKYKWLNKENNNKLIIFFNGWGMDEGVVKHLDPENYDVLMFYDYNNLETDFKPDKKYSETNIIAWSMGVMSASIICTEPHPLTPSLKGRGSVVVINGTLKPIDEKYGIHPKIYDLTIANFDEKGRDKFIWNMGVNVVGVNADFISCPLPDRTLENQKSELIALKNYKADLNFKPTKILISGNDKIIPTKNQCAFWGIEPNLKGGHCPFFSFKKWGELL